MSRQKQNQSSLEKIKETNKKIRSSPAVWAIEKCRDLETKRSMITTKGRWLMFWTQTVSYIPHHSRIRSSSFHTSKFDTRHFYHDCPEKDLAASIQNGARYTANYKLNIFVHEERGNHICVKKGAQNTEKTTCILWQTIIIS